jgi:hypothetical protein
MDSGKFAIAMALWMGLTFVGYQTGTGLNNIASAIRTK